MSSQIQYATDSHRRLRNRKRWMVFWMLLTLLAASGASCPRRLQTGAQGPIAFTQPPAIGQLLAHINANTQRVQRLNADGATLSVSGVPSLKAQLALERPKRFRLIAGLGLIGTELDLGSNDQHFWLWARRNEPKAVYYASHQDVANGASRHILPLPPSWLIEAIGLVSLDPNGPWDGPRQLGQGRLEIRTQVNEPSGTLTKVYVVDDQRGLILEQHVYDATGQLLASALASAHAYNSANQVTLPRRIDVQLPPAQMAFTLEVNGYTINMPSAGGDQLWAMPQIEGTPMVPLANAPAIGSVGSAGNSGARGMPNSQVPAGTIGWNNADEFIPR